MILLDEVEKINELESVILYNWFNEEDTVWKVTELIFIVNPEFA